jgi:hypothetical protein
MPFYGRGSGASARISDSRNVFLFEIFGNLGENVSSIAYSEQILDVLDHLGAYLTQKLSSRLNLNTLCPEENGRKKDFRSRMFSV